MKTVDRTLWIITLFAMFVLALRLIAGFICKV